MMRARCNAGQVYPEPDGQQDAVMAMVIRAIPMPSSPEPCHMRILRPRAE
jgi:hypothetical protein